MTSAAIVQKLWNYCNVLRDDGMSYGDYPSTSLRAGSEQLTYLLFLKMADERTKPPYNQPSAVPAKYNWPTLLDNHIEICIFPNNPGRFCTPVGTTLVS